MKHADTEDQVNRRNDDPAEIFGDFYLDFRDLSRSVRQSPYIVVLSVVLGLAGAIFYFFAASPTYTAKATLFPNSESGIDAPGSMSDLSSIAGLVSLTGRGREDNWVARHIAVLQSKAFLLPFLEEFDLVDVLVAPGTAESEVKHIQDAYEVFVKNHMVTEHDRITGLIYIRIHWPDSERAASIANELIHRLNAEQRARYVADANLKIEYLNEAVDNAVVTERRAMLFNLIEQEQRKILVARGEPEFVFEVLDPAISPIDPTSPKLVVALPLGFLVGLGIGIVAAVFLRGNRISKDRISGV